MSRRKLINWLQRRVLPGAALLLLLAGFSSFAQAAPSCLADVDSANDPSADGQGDITR